MYKVGMIGGKYLPLTQGHIDSIMKAHTMCEKLYIILSHNHERELELFKYSDMKPIHYKERLKWLYQAVGDLDNVHIIGIKDSYKDEESYDWDIEAKVIRDTIDEPINVVFHGDLESRYIFKRIYPEAEVITFDRTEIPVCATMLREGNSIYKRWNYVPDVVKPYFTKKVCIVGTESCAKSTLTKLLAKHYNTTFVREIGRDICENVGGSDALQDKDYYEIAIKHKAEEYKQLQNANRVLFIDTDSIVTDYYLGLYTNPMTSCGLFREISKINDYDLYIFLEPDVEWVQDGTRSHGDTTVREFNSVHLKSMLVQNGISWHTVKGDYRTRLQESIKLVDTLLN